MLTDIDSTRDSAQLYDKDQGKYVEGLVPERLLPLVVLCVLECRSRLESFTRGRESEALLPGWRSSEEQGLVVVKATSISIGEWYSPAARAAKDNAWKKSSAAVFVV